MEPTNYIADQNATFGMLINTSLGPMDLPPEVEQYIFSYLNPEKLASVRLVNRRWKVNAEDESLWRALVASDCPEKIGAKPEELTWKEFYIDCVSFGSRYDELVDQKIMLEQICSEFYTKRNEKGLGLYIIDSTTDSELLEIQEMYQEAEKDLVKMAEKFNGVNGVNGVNDQINVIRHMCGEENYDAAPVLELLKYGDTGWNDSISPDDLDENTPLVKGVDKYGRRFIAIQYTCPESTGTSRKVHIIFEASKGVFLHSGHYGQIDYTRQFFKSGTILPKRGTFFKALQNLLNEGEMVWKSLMTRRATEKKYRLVGTETKLEESTE